MNVSPDNVAPLPEQEQASATEVSSGGRG